jgi:histone-arginine methyltransferase CARM1
MLQDSVRTTTYRKSILDNSCDFKGKTVMDVGAGSGILSFFSAQAGASKVYAVEASSIADVARELARSNNLNQVEVIHKTLEAINKDEVDKVDILVSEPIGTFLFNERMIESYITARDKFLKEGGMMFPCQGNLCLTPFSDATLHWDLLNKNTFWRNKDFYGLDLSAAFSRAAEETFHQPVVDYINPEFINFVFEGEPPC